MMDDALLAFLGVRYIGERAPGKAGPGRVVVTVNGIETYTLPPKNDIWNHSPDGFNWGYAGSGPAQLALALCYDTLYRAFFRKPPELLSAASKIVTSQTLKVYQVVKMNLVAPIDTDTWELKPIDVLMVINLAYQKRAIRHLAGDTG